MRRAKRSYSHQRRGLIQHPRYRIYVGGLNRLLKRHFWQDRGQSFREHALSRAGRAYHYEIVPSARRDLKRLLRELLTHNIGKVGLKLLLFLLRDIPFLFLKAQAAGKVSVQLLERFYGVYLQPIGYRRLKGVFAGHKQPLQPELPRLYGHRQDPVYRS